jgi:hypothetical protein
MDDFTSSGNLLLFAIFALMFGNGAFGGFGNAGFANAIGYQNLATQNDVQRGFDNQNSMGNQREILSAVTNGTAQSVAASNQVFHDLIGYVGDKYNELDRDVLSLGAGIQQVIANQNDCCCSTKMLISETAAQNRYDALKNTNDINAVTIGQTQKILNAIAQNKIDALQGRVNQLELQNAVSGVVRYPSASTYNAGANPFCGCGMYA